MMASRQSIRTTPRVWALILLCAATVGVGDVPPATVIANEAAESQAMRGALVDPARVTPRRLQELQSQGTNCIVLMLGDPKAGDDEKSEVRSAVAAAKQADLAVAYWIEVARSPELAEQHPEWMASLQTHDEWRRFFPNTPKPLANEVAKTYPWVPILSRAPFQAQRERVLSLLSDLPPPKLIFLNDLQGAPSACGCGNPLCRWTSDYGERRTTIPLGDDAAALFVSAIQEASPASEVIPVWTTECEEHDGEPHGLCAGVGCFRGICWKAYTRQLMPVANTCERLAVLAPYKEFQRDTAEYGVATASWVRFAVETFAEMPPRHNGQAIPASRMIAVVQGWDASPEEIRAQRAAAIKAGANGCVVAYAKIEQSWMPRIVPWK